MVGRTWQPRAPNPARRTASPGRALEEKRPPRQEGNAADVVIVPWARETLSEIAALRRQMHALIDAQR